MVEIGLSFVRLLLHGAICLQIPTPFRQGSSSELWIVLSGFILIGQKAVRVWDHALWARSMARLGWSLVFESSF